MDLHKNERPIVVYSLQGEFTGLIVIGTANRLDEQLRIFEQDHLTLFDFCKSWRTEEKTLRQSPSNSITFGHTGIGKSRQSNRWIWFTNPRPILSRTR